MKILRNCFAPLFSTPNEILKKSKTSHSPFKRNAPLVSSLNFYFFTGPIWYDVNLSVDDPDDGLPIAKVLDVLLRDERHNIFVPVW